MAPKKEEWDTIKKAIIYGMMDDDGKKHYPTLTEASEIYNVSLSTLKKRSAREQWSQQRESHETKVAKKVSEEKSEYDAHRIVEMDERFKSFAETTLDIVELKMKDYKTKLTKGEWVAGIEILNTTSAAKNAQEMDKTANGEILERVAIEQNTNITDTTLLQDPAYITAKKKVMDEYYAHKKTNGNTT